MPKLAFVNANVVMALAEQAGIKAARYEEPQNPHLEGISDLLGKLGVTQASETAHNTAGSKPQSDNITVTV